MAPIQNIFFLLGIALVCRRTHNQIMVALLVLFIALCLCPLGISLALHLTLLTFVQLAVLGRISISSPFTRLRRSWLIMILSKQLVFRSVP